MTTAEGVAVATGTGDIPGLASGGVIAPWAGIASDPSGHVAVTTPREAAAAARSHSDSPAVLMLQGPPSGPACALPWSTVSTLILPDEHSVREFSARAYNNFDPSELPITHDTSLFEGEAGDAVSVGDAPDNLGSVNRAIGSAAAAHAVAIPASAPDAAAARERMTDSLVDPTPGDDATTRLIAAFEPLLTERTEDHSLLVDLVTRVVGLDPTAPLGGKTFVRELIEVRPGSDESTERALKAVIELLSGRRELKPFHAERGMRSVKALALFLLRQEPRDTVGWAVDQMSEDPLSVVVASGLAGARTGWKRLPWGMRGDTTARARFEAALADACEPDRSWTWSHGLAPLVGAIGDAEPDWDYFPLATGADIPDTDSTGEETPVISPDQLFMDLGDNPA